MLRRTLAGGFRGHGARLLRALRKSSATDVRRGLRNGEFIPYYQPVIDLELGACLGVEVLTRWQHPRRGLLEPGAFISVIEQRRMAVALTRTLIPQVVRDLSQLALPPTFHVAFNVTGEHFADRAFWADDSPVFDLLSANVTPLLEITERNAIVLSEPQRSEVKRAKARGLKLAIDDFGTGYCSLAYFKTFDLDVIKLDQSYVQAGSGDRVSTKVIDVIVEFARALDLTVIAEGVETEDQRARLIAKGIRLAQGYLFGRPMALSSLRPWLGERAHGVPISKVGYGTTNDFGDSAP